MLSMPRSVHKWRTDDFKSCELLIKYMAYMKVIKAIV